MIQDQTNRENKRLDQSLIKQDIRLPINGPINPVNTGEMIQPTINPTKNEKKFFIF